MTDAVYLYGQTDKNGEALYDCTTCPGRRRNARRCPKRLHELDEWEQVTGKTVPHGTWAHKRQWLDDYIGHMSEVNPDTGENRWMDDDSDYNASWELFPLFDGRLNLEANGEMWPKAITPITCGLLLVEPGIDELIETVVYLGEAIEPWVAGGTSEQPTWWIQTMHAVKSGRARLLEQHRNTLADDAEASK